MSSGTLEHPEPSFATSEELESLRAEVADLRRQLLALQAVRAPEDPLAATATLQAGYAALTPDAKALYAEAEAEARAALRGDPADG